LYKDEGCEHDEECQCTVAAGNIQFFIACQSHVYFHTSTFHVLNLIYKVMLVRFKIFLFSIVSRLCGTQTTGVGVREQRRICVQNMVHDVKDVHYAY
jgi:hypothetical protein